MIEHKQKAPTPEVEVITGTSFALLVALARAAQEPRDAQSGELGAALDQVGDATGEAWLNLLGIPLDAGAPYTAEHLLAELDAIDAIELGRHLLGRYAWSWCTLAGTEDIEAAAAGDQAAASRLLAHPRYYGGHAADSLAVLLALQPEEARRRIRRAVEIGLVSLIDHSSSPALQNAESAAAAALAAASPLEAIERVALGYRYVPEPEAERVLLIPHLEHSMSLVLAQHRAARLVVYRAGPEPGAEERLLALGRALADPKRIELLGLIARGVGRTAKLAEESGLSRSTVHYHLAQLRDAGLVAVEGNARAYAYVPRHAAAATAASLLADVIGDSSASASNPRGETEEE